MMSRTSTVWKVSPHPRAQDVLKAGAMLAVAAIAIDVAVVAGVVVEADAVQAAGVADITAAAVGADDGKASLVVGR
jgi:hypothetical protein